MKQFFLFFFLFCFLYNQAQEERKEIKGVIVVPEHFEKTGIAVYNSITGEGSVTTDQGFFTIDVKEGDSLYISSLQYRDLLVVVNKEQISAGFIKLEISEGVNELPEVIVQQYDLSGNLSTDVEAIKTIPPKLPDLSAASIAKLSTDAGESRVVNRAAGETGGPSTGLNIIAILGGLADLVLPDSKPRKKIKVGGRNKHELIELEAQLRERFSDTFFEETLGLPPEDIPFFMEYMEKKLPEELLRPEKEFLLIDFMISQSKLFREDFPVDAH